VCPSPIPFTSPTGHFETRNLNELHHPTLSNEQRFLSVTLHGTPLAALRYLSPASTAAAVMVAESVPTFLGVSMRLVSLATVWSLSFSRNSGRGGGEGDREEKGGNANFH